MTERVGPEQERFLGLTTLECGRRMVRVNPRIEAVHLRQYQYVPNTVTTNRELVIPVTRSAFLEGDTVERILSGLPLGANLALDSPLVLEGGEWAHFAMMDMAPRKSEEAKGKVLSRLREVVAPSFGGGYLLETGKSYHFFGEKILTQDEWYRFLGMCLVASIVTYIPDGPNQHEMICDYRYIGHSLIRGSTGLRISNSGGKDFLPKVVALV